MRRLTLLCLAFGVSIGWWSAGFLIDIIKVPPITFAFAPVLLMLTCVIIIRWPRKPTPTE